MKEPYGKGLATHPRDRDTILRYSRRCDRRISSIMYKPRSARSDSIPEGDGGIASANRDCRNRVYCVRRGCTVLVE